MYNENVIVENETGLHARPALQFVQTVARFKSNVSLKSGEKVANAKSIINILGLGIGKGNEISICAEGEDEKLAVKELVKLVKSKFGES